MGKTRDSANLVSDNNIFVDIANDRVGIGTTIPGYDLDVSGSINLSGNLYQNGSLFSGGGGGGGGFWTQIGIQTASNSASIEFNDLNSTYKKYRIEILYVKPATNSVNFYLFFSDDNNSTYFTTNYAWTFDGGASSVTTRANGQITTTTVSNTKYGNFTIDLYGMGTNIEPYAKTSGTYFDASPYFRNSDGSIMRNVATTTNAVTIKYSSGNIAEGTFILYGLS